MTSCPAGTLVDLLGAGHGDVALRLPETDAQITYGELADRVLALAGRLHGLGVRRGDRVALALPNGPTIVELLLAIMALGAAAAPLNPAYGREEYGFYLEDLAPRLLLLPGGEIAAARGAKPAGPRVVDVATGDGRVELTRRGTPST